MQSYLFFSVYKRTCPEAFHWARHLFHSFQVTRFCLAKCILWRLGALHWPWNAFPKKYRKWEAAPLLLTDQGHSLARKEWASDPTWRRPGWSCWLSPSVHRWEYRPRLGSPRTCLAWQPGQSCKLEPTGRTKAGKERRYDMHYQQFFCNTHCVKISVVAALRGS